MWGTFLFSNIDEFCMYELFYTTNATTRFSTCLRAIEKIFLTNVV